MQTVPSSKKNFSLRSKHETLNKKKNEKFLKKNNENVKGWKKIKVTILEFSNKLKLKKKRKRDKNKRLGTQKTQQE